MAGRLSRDVARADHHGKDEFVRARFIAQGFDVADGDGDLFAGEDVRDRLRENVRTLLIEQGGDVAGVPGVLVDGARFFAALDHAAHSAVAYLDGHVVDSSILRERESVDGFDVLGGRVGENLRDGDAGEKAADAGAHVGVLERAGAQDFAVLADDAKGAGRGAGGFSRRCGENSRLRAGDGENKNRHENREHGETGAPGIAFHTNLRDVMTWNLVDELALPVGMGFYVQACAGLATFRGAAVGQSKKRRPVQRSARHAMTEANRIVTLHARITGT